MTKLSILMATTDGKIEENQSFYSLPFDKDFNAIVVNQLIHSEKNLVSSNPYIKIFNVKERGISNSRNFAIAHAEADYVHFCDDDVTFLPNYLKTLLSTFEQNKTIDFFRFQIQTPAGSPFKNYEKSLYQLSRPSLQNKRKILLISSIEIVGKLKTIQEKHLKFDTSFGVGSGQYPMGEEAIFLLDALSKNCTLKYIPTPIVIHDIESSGAQLGKKQLQTLGILFQKVMGFWSIPFKAYYSMKKRKQLKDENITVWQAFQWMIKKDE